MIKQLKLGMASCAMLLLLQNCSDEAAKPNTPTTLAAISTSEVTEVTLTTAKTGGNVTSDGNLDVIARGICWSIAQNPTTNDSFTVEEFQLGEFTTTLTGLNPGTNYFIRAYVTNSKGTAYGEQMSFTTNPLTSPVQHFDFSQSLYGTENGNPVLYSAYGDGTYFTMQNFGVNPPWVADRHGNASSALDFPVSYDRLLGKVDLGTSSSISIACWFKSSSTDGSLAEFITVQSSSDAIGISASSQSPNLVQGYEYSDGFSRFILVNGSYTAAEWTHVVITADDNKVKLYVNGQLESEDTRTSNFLAFGNADCYIGNDDNWHGSIDDVRVYDSVLGEEEIQVLNQE